MRDTKINKKQQANAGGGGYRLSNKKRKFVNSAIEL